jgi:hypothetical protein
MAAGHKRENYWTKEERCDGYFEDVLGKFSDAQRHDARTQDAVLDARTRDAITLTASDTTSPDKALHLQCKMFLVSYPGATTIKCSYLRIVKKSSRSAKYTLFSSIVAHSLSEMAQIEPTGVYSGH